MLWRSEEESGVSLSIRLHSQWTQKPSKTARRLLQGTVRYFQYWYWDRLK
jgi:hypothetical protein